LSVVSLLGAYFKDVTVSYFIENRNFAKIGSRLSTASGGKIEIISLNTLRNYYSSGTIEAVAIPSTYHAADVKEAVDFCLACCISPQNIYIVPFTLMNHPLESLPPPREDILVPFDKFLQIYELTIHVTDHCNLRCKSCVHFSSLVGTEFFYDSDIFAKDCDRLAQCIPNICNISLLGGEPLLHKELHILCEIARKVFPISNISILTNGILLPNIGGKLLDSIRANNVGINISLYPPLVSRLDDILHFLNNHGLNYTILNMDKFFRMLRPEKIFDGQASYARCFSCKALRPGGKLHKCIWAAYIDYFNATFGKIFPEDEGLNIYTTSRSDIIEELKRPLEMCTHCAGRGFDVYPWEMAGTKQQPEDWYLDLRI
jgi:hypothetical protein